MWQLPKWSISQEATSQVCPSNSAWFLARSSHCTELVPLAYSSHSAQPPNPLQPAVHQKALSNLWEVAVWKCHIWEVSTWETVTWEVALGKMSLGQ